MPENQIKIAQNSSTIITDSSTLKSKFENNEYKISGFNISLEYSEFINALQELSKAVFTNCYFTITYSESQNYNCNFKCEIIFDTCIFKENFALLNLSLANNITFKYSVFKSISFIDLSVDNTLIDIKVLVSECIITSDIEINLIFNQQLIIELIGDYKIRKDYSESQLIICSITNYSIQYENYEFNKNELLEYENYNILCVNCNFNIGIYLDNTVYKSIVIIRCKFLDIVDFNSSETKYINIINTSFYNKLLLEEIKVEEIKLINCSFENTVKIVNTNGSLSNLTVERTTIKAMFFFNGFGNNKLITMSNSNSIISFEHIFIEDSGYLIIRKIRNGKFNFDYANVLGQIVMQELDIDSLQMHNASIIGSLILQDIKLKELDLKNTSLIGKLVFNPSDTLNIFDSNIIQNRETAYLLKKGKQEEGDSISASHFKRKELQLYLKDCTSNFNPNKVKECIVLFLNKISNDFGQSWVRGIIFTMLLAFIFFILINYIGLDDENQIFEITGRFEDLKCFGNIWVKYLKILNVLNFNDKLEQFQFNAWGETLFFVSKIFVSYGIYQTVSAFRKFGK